MRIDRARRLLGTRAFSRAVVALIMCATAAGPGVEVLASAPAGATATPTPLPGKGLLVINEQTVGGTGSFSYITDIPGTPLVTLDTTTTNPASQSFDLDPGSYNVIQAAPTGWNLDGISCDTPGGDTTVVSNNLLFFQIAADHVVTCTFTNTKLGSLVIKVDSGGDPGTFSFNGDSPVGAQTVDTTTGSPQSVTISVAPGTYDVTGTIPTGWALGSLQCDDTDSTTSGATASYHIAAGETVTCTWTDTHRGRLVINEQTVGGTASVPFITDIPGSPLVTLDTSTANPASQSFDVDPGTYNVIQSAPVGWHLDGISCTTPDGDTTVINNNLLFFTIGVGHVITCTFTNSPPTTPYTSHYGPDEYRFLFKDALFFRRTDLASTQHDAAMFLAYLGGVAESQGQPVPNLGSQPGAGLLAVTTAYNLADTAAIQHAATLFGSDPATVQRIGVDLVAYLLIISGH